MTYLDTKEQEGDRMSVKTDIPVVIGGKVYTLSGYEGEEYLQKIALYINSKMTQLNEMPNYKRMNSDMQKILLDLNLADDYYKAKNQIDLLEKDMEEKDRIEYDLKHELIASQIRLEEACKEIDDLKAEINELQKQIVKLELKAGL